MPEKWFHCEKCRKFPDEIIEVSKGLIVRTRHWDGECYELADSSIGESEFTPFCPECNGTLTERGQP